MSAGSVGTNPIQAAIQALQWGTPYKKGGTTPAGVDAAGLVQWVFAQAGVQLPARANQQYSQGYNVPVGPPGNPLAYVQPGDVIFQGTSDPNTEQEGIVYSTAGQGTVITSVPGNGVSYLPIKGAIDTIRRYSGDPTSGQAGDPYSSTMPIFQVVQTDFMPTSTVGSSSFTTPGPSNPHVYSSRVYELAVIMGVVALVIVARRRLRNG